MKNLILGAAVVALAAACGGGSKPQLIDASIDAQMVCNPIAQTGCMANEKCTWLVDADANPATMTAEIGHVGCAPVDATAIPDGMTCANGKAGVTGGADNCVQGDICISRICKQICDPQLASGAGAGACDATHACLSYRGVFESASAPTAGACEVGCDPLTQQLATNKSEACGSADPTMPSGTCVPTSGEFKSFACAPSLTMTATDRMAPLGDSRGFFGNGCAAGFLPFFFEDASGAMKTLCSGMCAPVKMDSTIYAADMATNPDINGGDPMALGKLPADMKAIAGHATCQIGVKGSLTQAEGTEDCRFIWAPLAISSNQSNPTPVDTPYNNTLGMCFAYSKFISVDTNNDQKPDAPEKSCRELGTTADPIYGTAEENGCYPLAGFPGGAARAPLAFKPNPHRIGSFRLAYGTGVVARPVFE
jgi:hypothetical protein